MHNIKNVPMRRGAWSAEEPFTRYVLHVNYRNDYCNVECILNREYDEFHG